MEIDRGRVRGADPSPCSEDPDLPRPIALTDAKLQANQIDKVVLVGGATRTPLVHRLLEERLGRPVHPRDRARPGRGHGRGRAGRPDRRRRCRRRSWSTSPRTPWASRRWASCTGSCRVTLFSPIIERNTPLPATRTEIYLTACDGRRRPISASSRARTRTPGTIPWSATS